MKKEYIGIILIVIFSLMAFSVVMDSAWIVSLDRIGNQLLRLNPSPALTSMFLMISRMGNHLTLIGVTVLIFAGFILAKKTELGIWFAGTMAINGTLAPFILKYVFERPRPSDGLFTRTGFSFPSGHSTGAAVFYGLLFTLVLLYVKKKSHRIAACTLISLLVGLILWSRVYLGFHFTTDILASLALGIGQLLCSYTLFEQYMNEQKSLAGILKI